MAQSSQSDEPPQNPGRFTLDNHEARLLTVESGVYVDGSGNVGISGHSPTAKLDVTGTMKASGAVQLGSTLLVTGATTLAALSAGATTLSSTLGVTGATTLGALSAGSTTLSSTLGVTGGVTLSSTLGVTGAATFSSSINAGALTITTLNASGAATLGSTLGVTGATTLGTLNAGATTISSTLGVTGGTTLGALSAAATTLSSTLGVSGAATFSSTLGVTGATTLSSTLNVSGVTKLNSNVAIGNTTPTVALEVQTTDAAKIPVGTNAQRPTGAIGQIRYNTDTSSFEGYGGAGWASLGSGNSGLSPTFVSGTTSAAAGYLYAADSTSGAFTITLPASPVANSIIGFADYKGIWGTNNVTVSRNGKTINGSATDLTLDINRGYVSLIYNSSTADWVVTDVSAALPSPSSAVGILIGTRVFTSGGTYSPTQGTQFVIVEAVGGGGGGGGCGATGAGQVAAAGPGGSGAYGKAKFTSNFSGVTLTVGAAGTGGTSGGGTGGTGGATSFGALLSCPGGLGGSGGGANSPGTPYINMTVGQAAAPTGANLVGFAGTVGQNTFLATYGNHFFGQGGCNPLGVGGLVFAVGTPAAGSGYGSGGSGAIIGNSTAAQAGATGAPGVIIVYEYA